MGTGSSNDLHFYIAESEEEEIVPNPLEQWYHYTTEREITLVTAGCSRAGKSTLISNILKLKDDAKDEGHPQHQHSPSVTKEVEIYSSLREEGITVHVVDTPGLNASDVNDARAMALLQEKTGGKCDILLFCVSLLSDSKIDKEDKEDKEVLRKLTLVFGQEVWRHAVLVLTFTNAVKGLYPEQSIKDLVEEYAKKFQSVLHFTFKSDISVVSVFSCDRTQTQREADTIIAVPAGYSPDKRLIKKLRQGWDEMIFGEVLKKCNPDVVPVLFKTKHPFHPRIIQMLLNVCKFTVGTILFAAIGGQPLSLVTGFLGAQFGELIRWFTPRVGARLGETVGYASGLGVAGVMVAIGLFIGLQEKEREQCELDAVQKELDNCRKNIVKVQCHS